MFGQRPLHLESFFPGTLSTTIDAIGGAGIYLNRYKSVLCDVENYLLAPVRAIHLSPIRAKVVRGMGELGRYPWSGHRVVMGKGDMPGKGGHT
jgi:hypothetical protein